MYLKEINKIRINYNRFNKEVREMFDYTIYGLKLRSDIEFLQLVPDNSDKEPDIFMVAGEIPEDILAYGEASMSAFEDNRSWLINRTMRMFITDGTTITYALKPGKSEIYLRAYLLGFGLSMLCLQRGLMTIHCSALVINGKAYLISGESGSGKSTISGILLKNNNQFLADDVTAVAPDSDGTVYVEPAFPYQKLCRDAALNQGYSLDELIYIDEDKDKFLVPCKDLFCYNKVPIGGLIYLYVHKGDEVVYKDLAGIDTFHIVVNNLFLRKLLREKKYTPSIGQKCLEIAAGIRACSIGRPDGKDSLDEILVKVNKFINEEK